MSLDAKHIGARIRALRERKGETQVEFGKAIGSTPITVRNWEHGRTVPVIAKLKKIAAHFVVDVEFLTGGTLRIAEAREQALQASREILASKTRRSSDVRAASSVIKDQESALTQTTDTAADETRQLMEDALDRVRRKIARLGLGES